MKGRLTIAGVDIGHVTSFVIDTHPEGYVTQAAMDTLRKIAPELAANCEVLKVRSVTKAHKLEPLLQLLQRQQDALRRTAEEADKLGLTKTYSRVANALLETRDSINTVITNIEARQISDALEHIMGEPDENDPAC